MPARGCISNTWNTMKWILAVEPQFVATGVKEVNFRVSEVKLTRKVVTAVTETADLLFVLLPGGLGE